MVVPGQFIDVERYGALAAADAHAVALTSAGRRGSGCCV